MYKVKVLDSKDSNWDNIVKSSNFNSHAFDWKWKDIIEDSFSHKAYYLAAIDNGEVKGILPLFHFESSLFGSSLISLPFLNAGGILTRNRRIKEFLLNYAIHLTKDKKCKYLEIRSLEDYSELADNLHPRLHKISMKLELAGDEETQFNTFSSKLRSQIRRPEKDNLTAKVSSDNNAIEDLESFYSVFSTHMRDLGTPVYPKIFFKKVLNSFSAETRVITVWSNDTPVSAAITIGKHSTVEVPWASSLSDYKKSSPNMLLYWTAIKTAIKDGYKEFDFGRSTKNSPTQKFKTQWGAKEVQLYWYYYLNKGKVPEVNPNNKKFSFLVNCWKKLPLPVSNTLGPMISRNLP